MDSASMSTNNDENLDVDNEHDDARHDVDENHMHDHDAWPLAADADRRHEEVPAEAPLYRRICGSRCRVDIAARHCRD